MGIKTSRLFIYSAAVILFSVATAKLVSSFGHGTILESRDPIIEFRFRDLFRMVAVVEAVVAMICISSKGIRFPAKLIAWLATCFAAYHIGLAIVGYHRPCNCMGGLTDALHLSAQTSAVVMKISLLYLLIGSYATLFWLWRQNKKVVGTV